MPARKKLEGESTVIGFNILVSDLDYLRGEAHRRSVGAGREISIGDIVRDALSLCHGEVQGNNVERRS